MLIVKVYINERPIDLILIHNTGKKEKGKDVYTVEDIEGKNILSKTIKHKRSAGYRPLLKQVLTQLNKDKIEEFRSTFGEM
jgi:hypothetical protein